MTGRFSPRQYFNSTSAAAEISLRATIDTIWKAVDWNWYRQNGQNTLYWNWSPNYGWAIGLRIGGLSEALITYVLAASAVNPIPKNLYYNGWALNRTMANGQFFYGIKLTLGPN